jgi:hypothetical protein
MRLLDDYNVFAFQITKDDRLKDAPSSTQLTPTTPQFADSHARLMTAPFSPTLDMDRLKAHD